MKILNHLRSKIFLIFSLGILVLVINFLLISCGTSPMLKVFDNMKGPYALDFSLAPGTDAGLVSASNDYFPSISGQPLKVESWVKRKTDPLRGIIFSHADTGGGIELYVQNNIVKGKAIYSSAPSYASSTISSEYTLPLDQWVHVSFVLNNSPNTNCPTNGNEIPHLEIYIDGELKNCATTKVTDFNNNQENYAADPVDTDNPHDPCDSDERHSAYIGYSADVGLGVATARLDAAVDDVKLIVNNKTILHWPLNEGRDYSVFDISGSGINGEIYSPAPPDSYPACLNPEPYRWTGGWITGVD
jgi:hypothetical protein